MPVYSLISSKYFGIIALVCISIYLRMVLGHRWRPEDNFPRVSPSFLYMGPRDGTQVTTLGPKNPIYCVISF